jgi:hypothetical protein
MIGESNPFHFLTLARILKLLSMIIGQNHLHSRHYLQISSSHSRVYFDTIVQHD